MCSAILSKLANLYTIVNGASSDSKLSLIIFMRSSYVIVIFGKYNSTTCKDDGIDL